MIHEPVKTTKNEVREILKWGLPFLSIEILLFIIFFQFFAYVFVTVGILGTMVITMYIIYQIKLFLEKKL